MSAESQAAGLVRPVYRNQKLDLRTRIDAAAKALPYEVAKIEQPQAAPDVVPLHERIREYEREKIFPRGKEREPNA